MQAVVDVREPLTHGFLLIEPATLIEAPALAELDMRPCTPRVLAHREELMPRLIALAELDEQARAAATDVWQAEPHAERPPVVCAWLDSDDGIDVLAEHVARYLVGPGVDGKPVFWRYYDPRVLTLALTVLEPAQRQALLGPIRTWQFAWAGHRWAMRGPGIAADALEGHVPAWPTAEQWLRLNRSEVMTQVLNRLPVPSVDDAALLPSELDRILSDAMRHGLTDDDALTDYAWHCVKYGPAFERHPTLVDGWPLLAAGEITWPDIVMRFTPDDFASLEPSRHSRNA
ncbi:DUF4123 domain-containing protein [Burkholderia sp. S-53]|uniref:DUF4123 domain-containing protein n=1 Tax=Burkholderia sp. S-53 TaxID=2906514 RepID=UPI0021D383B7|nr:DUF4123 domain-containing protein [Burkholderia sp. S-53]UXU85863.1 DUF4123 domain-containing protein [Burkholderia sp. S-53]